MTETTTTPQDPTSPSIKKTLVIVLLFALSFFVVDRALGYVLEMGLSKTVTGEGSGQANFAIQQRDKDVIIFGSSRAKQHYDPTQIEKAMGWSGYNAGANGQGLYYARGIQMVMLKRKAKAKVHVIHVDAVDLITPYIKRAAFLLPFMSEAPELLHLFAVEDRWLWLKSMLHTYRYNSMMLPIVKNLVVKRKPNPTGFKPKPAGVTGVAAADQFIGQKTKKVTLHKDALKTLRAFVQDAKANNIKVMIITSPMNLSGKMVAKAQERRKLAHDALSKLAKEEQVLYYNFDEKQYPQFQDKNLFIDRGHLNSDGAKVLTDALIKKLEAAR